MPQCPTVIRGCTGPRTVVRHSGPPGRDGLPGPAGEVTSDSVSSDDGEIVLFSGTSGERIKRSNTMLAALATVAALAGKVDAVPGFGLSEQNFTTALLTKLNGLSSGTFRGVYDTPSALTAAIPFGNLGDYAYVVSPIPNPSPDPGEQQTIWIWDEVNDRWTDASVSLDGADIAALLFAEPNVNNFDDTAKAKLNQAVTQTYLDSVISTLSGGSTPTALATVVTEGTTARTLSVGDVGFYIRLTNAAGCAITIPNDATAVWTFFPEIQFRIATATPPTLVLGAGVTVNGAAILPGLTLDQNFRLKKIGADAWDLVIG